MENSASDRFDDEDEDEDAMDAGAPGAFSYDLGADHYIRFKRRGEALLVTFQSERGDTPLAESAGRFDDLANDMQWSSMTLFSRGDTWFRAPEVIAFFDAMVDGTLLDRFSDVLFVGQGTGGHGAMAYSLTVPGARVMALSPHLGFGRPGLPEDARFTPPEGVDFNARYRVNAPNLAGAQAVWLLHDPNRPSERAHVEAIGATAALHLRCRNLGPDIAAGLTDLGLLDEMIVRAMEGDLDAPAFYRALRARRDDPAALRRLIGRLIDGNRPLLEALAVRNVALRTGRHRFAQRFEHLEAELKAKGIIVPASRTG